MLKDIKYVITLSVLFISCVLFADTQDDIRHLSAMGTSALTVSLGQADVVLAKSLINTTHIKGDIGESVVSKYMLNPNGHWQGITPRSGRQGLDHLYIKTNRNGTPTDLMVGETKYGSSKLALTKDGMQMGTRWSGKRLIALGNRYMDASFKSNIIINRNMPFSPNRQLEVVLKSGKQVYFWANSSKDTWKFSGSINELNEAQKLAKQYGIFFAKAGSNTITYRSRIYHVRAHGNDLIVDMYDATKIDKIASANQKTLSVSKLGKPESLTIKNALNTKTSIDVSDDIAKSLQSKLPHMSRRDINSLARKIQKTTTPEKIMSGTSNVSSAMKVASTGFVLAAVTDIAIQSIATGKVDLNMTAITGSSVAVGAVAGLGVNQALISNATAYNAISKLSGSLGLSSSTLASGIGQAAGGALTSVFLSYGLYFAGYSDLETATRNSVAGTAGTALGAGAGVATMALLSTYGTAGTGVAISSLSGAAATNASLAVLGGGTVAAGGGGMALGAAVLTGGVAIVAIAGTAAVMYSFHVYDEKQELKRMNELISSYSENSIMDKIVAKSYYVKQLAL